MKIAKLLLLINTIGIGNMTQAAECPTLLEHEMPRLHSTQSHALCDIAGGKVTLVVNTASKCGFTPQFEALEQVYQTYKDRGFVVLGFPSNDFAQELGKSEAIAAFCRINYGVSFPMFEKLSVKGDNAHPFYRDLAEQANSKPRWNFHKYLIGRDGQVVDHFYSWTSPDSKRVKRAIEALL